MSGRPERIISLVPSQTELLYDLGAGDRVVGITKFCVHPEEWFRSKVRVGGTKKVNFEKIAALRPDLIIANKEENQKEQIEELMKNYPVWMSDIHNLQDALKMITDIGEILDEKNAAEAVSNVIRKEFEKLKLIKTSVNLIPRNMRTAYVIWKNPLMCAGNSTFINDMLETCGLQNCFSERRDSRYPEISEEELKKTHPELILLSSEPYPFGQKHLEEFQNLCPESIIRLVDGELFSWYGSRLKKAPGYFLHLLESLLE